MNKIPLVLLSHRKREFLETTLESIYANMHNVGEIAVVDDSGDYDHQMWLTRQEGILPRFSHPNGVNAGYLLAMNTVWEVAAVLADHAESDYVMLWEEDFVLTRTVDLHRMAMIMEDRPGLAQLNLQRQPVYKVERRLGYMRSHQMRSYQLQKEWTEDEQWVSRFRPFTTNPGLIRREVLDVEWPDRVVCDATRGGAEPAMSAVLEADDWYFGWYGPWDVPYTKHVGTTMKTGKGY